VANLLCIAGYKRDTRKTGGRRRTQAFEAWETVTGNPLLIAFPRFSPQVPVRRGEALSLSVISTRGARPCLLRNLRITRLVLLCHKIRGIIGASSSFL